MLQLDQNLEAVSNFTVDIIGLATKYDMTVMRWGCALNASCVVTPALTESHLWWLGVDVDLVDPTKAEALKTDCAIAGLVCMFGNDYVHIQPSTYQGRE